MAAKKEKPVATQAKAKEAKTVSFTCKFCEKVKPLDEMTVTNLYFPPIILCRDCEKTLR